MNVYSFYKKIYKHPHDLYQLELIEYWKKAWSKYGWNPIVLGMDDIERNDYSKKFYNFFTKLPTHNALSVEMAVWLFYLVVKQVTEKTNDDLFCISAGYDNINFGLTPDFFPKEPCYYKNPAVYPSIQTQQSWTALIDVMFDKLSNEKEKYFTNWFKAEIANHVSDDHFFQKLEKSNEFPIKLALHQEGEKYQVMNNPLMGYEFDIYKEAGLSKENPSIVNWDRERLEKTKKLTIEKLKQQKIFHCTNYTYKFCIAIFEKELMEKYSIDKTEHSSERVNNISKIMLLEYIDELLG